MKICFLADGHSPITRQWVGYCIAQGHDVHLISSFPCDAVDFQGATVSVVPLAFAGVVQGKQREQSTGGRRRLDPRAALRRIAGRYGRGIWHVVGCLELFRHRSAIRREIESVRPDIVHALRIPFEGMMASIATPRDVPLIVSIWGNDFTLQAARNPLIAAMTRMTMRRADAIHADCERDVRLAHEWGLNLSKRTIVLPGAGGVDLDTFFPGEPSPRLQGELDIPESARIVINPRGLRTYVQNETFFAAIPSVVAAEPNVVFLCCAMEGQPAAKTWVARYGLTDHVRLLPSVPHADMADHFRLADISISPSLHDGTPNSLLESMACGCYPIAGDIESVREWIDDGENGLLVDPTSKEAIASAITRALSCTCLEQAKERNEALIRRRADRRRVITEAESFYREVASDA